MSEITKQGARRGAVTNGFVFAAVASFAAFGFFPGFVAAAHADTTKVMQVGRKFQPVEVTISVGDTVQISNNDEFIHQVFVDSPTFKFDSDESPPGHNIDVKFTERGDFRIQCHTHPKMLLIVHVK